MINYILLPHIETSWKFKISLKISQVQESCSWQWPWLKYNEKWIFVIITGTGKAQGNIEASYRANMCLGRIENRSSGTYGGKCSKEDFVWIQGLSNRPGSDFPAEVGMLLPDETYEARSSSALIADVDEIEAAKALTALRRCDEFLKRHGIRPEFFCRHRERLALQAWLLERSKLYSGKCLRSSSCRS